MCRVVLPLDVVHGLSKVISLELRIRVPGAEQTVGDSLSPQLHFLSPLQFQPRQEVIILNLSNI